MDELNSKHTIFQGSIIVRIRWLFVMELKKKKKKKKKVILWKNSDFSRVKTLGCVTAVWVYCVTPWSVTWKLAVIYRWIYTNVISSLSGHRRKTAWIEINKLPVPGFWMTELQALAISSRLASSGYWFSKKKLQEGQKTRTRHWGFEIKTSPRLYMSKKTNKKIEKNDQCLFF